LGWEWSDLNIFNPFQDLKSSAASFLSGFIFLRSWAVIYVKERRKGLSNHFSIFSYVQTYFHICYHILYSYLLIKSCVCICKWNLCFILIVQAPPKIKLNSLKFLWCISRIFYDFIYMKIVFYNNYLYEKLNSWTALNAWKSALWLSIWKVTKEI
jgi:hypothetical protein